MKYFHVYTHCHRKWRKIEAIYDLPDPTNLQSFSESAQVHGIGNVCVLTLFINSRGPSIVSVSFFYHHVVVLAVFLSGTFANGLYTNWKDVLDRELRSYVIVVSLRCHFVPAFIRSVSAEKNFRLSPRYMTKYHLKAVKSKIKLFCMKTQKFGFVRYQYLHLYK